MSDVLPREATIAAEKLHDEFCEVMMASGEALTFAVEHDPGSGYVRITLGGLPLWDSEDENDGGNLWRDNIEEYCRKELNRLANLFAAFKQ